MDLPYVALLAGLALLLLLGGVIYFFVERRRGRERLRAGTRDRAHTPRPPPPVPAKTIASPPPPSNAQHESTAPLGEAAPLASEASAPLGKAAPLGAAAPSASEASALLHALPRPGDAVLLFPSTPLATLDQLLDRVTAANAADLDEDGRAKPLHVTAHAHFQKDVLPGGGTTVDTFYLGAETTLYLLLQLRALDAAAVADAEAWVTLRAGDLHMVVGEERSYAAIRRVYDRYDDFAVDAGDSADPHQLDPISAAIARELLPYAPPLGTQFYAYVPPERPADAFSVDLVSERDEAYVLQYPDETRERFLRVDEARRPFRTPREAQLAAEERIHGRALSAGAKHGDAVPDHVAKATANARGMLTGEKIAIPTAAQLTSAVAAGDGVLLVSLSAKRVERALTEGDVLLGRLLETGEVIRLGELTDGRTAITVDRGYGISLLALLVAVLRPRVADPHPQALAAWATAQGFDHFTTEGILVAGTPYYLRAEPAAENTVLATLPDGQTYAIPVDGNEDQKPLPRLLAETHAYVPPSAEVEALQRANPPPPVDLPAADTAPHIPDVVPPPGDRVIVTRDTSVASVRGALAERFGQLPPELDPALAQRPDGATVLTFPDATALDQLCVILDGLARGLRLDARRLGGHATFATADARMAIDPMRMMSATMDFHANWLQEDEEHVDEAEVAERPEALLRFVNAQLAHGGPREGTQVHIYPVAESTPEDPVVGLTDAAGQGYRYYAQRLGRQLRRVAGGEGVRAFEGR